METQPDYAGLVYAERDRAARKYGSDLIMTGLDAMLTPLEEEEANICSAPGCSETAAKKYCSPACRVAAYRRRKR